jgi:hypothetical protein
LRGYFSLRQTLLLMLQQQPKLCAFFDAQV